MGISSLILIGMNYYLTRILLETPAPGDVVIDDTWYSPGVIGFIGTFGVAAGAIVIIFDMVRRIRRVRYRAEINEKLDFEEAISSLKEDQKPKAKAAPSVVKKPATQNKKPDRPAPPAKPSR
jgi:hypothetical protein